MSAADLDGWIPTGLFWEGERPVVDWCFAPDIRFTDPFFDVTLERAMRHPFRLLFRRRTGVEVLEESAARYPGIEPTGFIFHTSRCGSTLIAQMLAALESNIVVSEGWPLDSVLNADAGHLSVTDEDRRRWISAMVRALGQQRDERSRRYFLKFDARHALDLPVVRRAFPSVPWVFVYREPLEVLVSHFENPSLWTFPGIVPVRGIDPPPSEAEYSAAVIHAICTAAIGERTQGSGMLLNYRELPDAFFSRISPHFGCEWTAEEIETMRGASNRDAKNPSDAFTPDTHRKQREADPLIREICERRLREIYLQLESE